MKLEVCLYASLASRLPRHSGGNCCTMEVSNGISVREVLEQLGIGPEETKLILVNGIHVKPESPLKDGDRLAVFPPIAGG